MNIRVQQNLAESGAWDKKSVLSQPRFKRILYIFKGILTSWAHVLRGAGKSQRRLTRWGQRFRQEYSSVRIIQSTVNPQDYHSSTWRDCTITKVIRWFCLAMYRYLYETVFCELKPAWRWDPHDLICIKSFSLYLKVTVNLWQCLHYLIFEHAMWKKGN